MHVLESESLAALVNRSTGISAQKCYQCGKCSAGCPAAVGMDIAPNVVMRLLQVGTESADQKLLRSYSIWLCLACHTCDMRCPMEIDLPGIIDVLRSESLRRGAVNPRARDIVAFHKSFFDNVRLFGRMWEIGLIGEYNVRTRHFLQDILLAPSMLVKRKLSLWPGLHGRLVSRIFSRGIGRLEKTR